VNTAQGIPLVEICPVTVIFKATVCHLDDKGQNTSTHNSPRHKPRNATQRPWTEHLKTATQKQQTHDRNPHQHHRQQQKQHQQRPSSAPVGCHWQGCHLRHLHRHQLWRLPLPVNISCHRRSSAHSLLAWRFAPQIPSSRPRGMQQRLPPAQRQQLPQPFLPGPPQSVKHLGARARKVELHSVISRRCQSRCSDTPS